MRAIRDLTLRLRAAIRVETGAVTAEYGLLLTLIALAIIVAVTAYGASVLGLFEQGTAEFPAP
jgi:Flp pilus assembly pilin Flp